MFSQVFSMKSIHLLEKRMLWLNGRQILPTLHGWKVRNDIHDKCTSNRVAIIISVERILLLFELLVLARAHTVHAFRVPLSFIFFWHNGIPIHFLPCSFEEVNTYVCFSFRSPPHYILFVVWTTPALWCEINVNICFRSRWGDLWWRAQRELWLQHGFVIFFFSSYISQIQYCSSCL